MVQVVGQELRADCLWPDMAGILRATRGRALRELSKRRTRTRRSENIPKSRILAHLVAAWGDESVHYCGIIGDF